MKRTSRLVAAVLCVGVWSSTASPAAAQSSDKDADAERLFREGQKLMEDRRYGEACPKLEAAYRKDQQLGTLLNLAYCHKEQGAVWQAWVEFKEAEVKATELKRADRRDFARQRMAELEKSLARVVVEPQQKVELTEVLVEERHVPEAEKGVTFASEIGQRKFTFRAKGKKQVVQLVTVVKGDRPQRIVVPAMEEEDNVPVAVETPAPRIVEEPKRAPSTPAGEVRDGSGQRTVALVLLGVGVVGAGIGTATGLMTLSNECTKSAKRENPAGCPSSPAGQDKTRAGETTGLIADISFGVSGAALVTALVLYLTAPSAPTSATVGAAKGARSGIHVMPEIGSGWAGLRGVF
ncbi:MAG: hypothetical protein BGO98_47000 [Myxococcales bacterium 68-20]|nr:MAG: hypothetical protein BGO98_47000 [Myxococcales bacterium 68-20]